MPDLISIELLEEYQQAAVQWEPTLLELPFSAASDVLVLMTGCYGIRGKRNFQSVDASSQFAPFKKDRDSKSEVRIKTRTLETFEGNVIDPFCPNDYAMLVMGYKDKVLGEELKNASTAALVLMMLAKARGAGIAQAVLTGVRNPDGDTCLDLCDGLVTIADKEIKAGNISVADKNLYKLQEKFTNLNACDIAKDIVFKADPFLRRQNSVLLCSQAFADAYNESFLASHPAVVYNQQYNQPYVEGSNGKVTLVPLAELENSTKFILTDKANMLYGTDNESDASFVDVMRVGHYDLSFASNIWLGAQFNTIDPRRLMIVDLADTVEP